MSDIWKRFDAAFERMGSMFDSMHEIFDGLGAELAAEAATTPDGETETTTHEEETRPDGTRIVRTTTVRTKKTTRVTTR